MKNIIRISVVILISCSTVNANAQLFKRLKKKLEDKLERKVEQKVDRKMDKTIDDVIDEKPKANKKSAKKIKENNDTFGSVIMTHNNTYGNVSIPEISEIKVNKSDDVYTITGAWWSHEADIFDGFRLNINTSEMLKHDEKDYNKTTTRTFKIPEEASLTLGYDPSLPYYESVGDDNMKQAVTDAYQNVDMSKGTVTLDVMNDDAIQVSFDGKVTLVKRVRNSSDRNDVTETFFESTLKGGIDAKSPKYSESKSKNKTATETSQSITYNDYVNGMTDADPAGVYKFTFETVSRVTTSDSKDNIDYTMSYLHNPDESYFGIMTNMGEMTENEMQGESFIVMDDGNTHIFVEAAGMKMQLSGGKMVGQQVKNPTEQMSEYDLSKIKKTGKTKTILGATCYEYIMTDKDVTAQYWAAPSIQLPNWFG
ncbi:hypothetical protein, partial [Psychroserpens sp.]|uniref:hypothetical protein n=1 Tax=Psychroserpens sp. TaxID=2020870 RepID=UPI003C730A34